MTIADLIFVVLFALLAVFAAAVALGAVCLRYHVRTKGEAPVLSDLLGHHYAGKAIVFDSRGHAEIVTMPNGPPEPPTPRSPGVVVPIDSARKERPRA